MISRILEITRKVRLKVLKINLLNSRPELHNDENLKRLTVDHDCDISICHLDY